MSNINLAVIIVTYNSEEVIGRCLESLKHLQEKYTVFISDNNSSDSTNIISESYGCVVSQNGKNLGYSKAINKAFNNYVTSEYTHLLILNPDVFFNDKINVKVILENSCDKDVTSIEMKSSDGVRRVSTFKFPSIFNLYFNRHRLDTIEGTNTSEVEAVEGSFMLMKSELFRHINGFDNNIFLYGEDYEFCYRVKANGGNVIYNPVNYYVHDGGFNPSRKPLVLNGLKYFFKKHRSTFVYFYAVIVIKIKELLAD